jgi:hypothetical protein
LIFDAIIMRGGNFFDRGKRHAGTKAHEDFRLLRSVCSGASVRTFKETPARNAAAIAAMPVPHLSDEGR